MSNKELFTKNMLKISDVAQKLGVEGYVIFEKITYNSDVLHKHIHKVQSIRYIDEQGIKILEEIIKGDLDKSGRPINSSTNDADASDEKFENKSISQNRLVVDVDIFSGEHEFLEKARKIEAECVELEKIIQNDRQILTELDKIIMRLEYEIRDAFQQKDLIFKSKESSIV